jgi:hypothetical protein
MVNTKIQLATTKRMPQMRHELSSFFADMEEGERCSNVERIVTSYRHPWDVYAELLQNSVDAIFEAKKGLHAQDAAWRGKIEIVVDSEKCKITVADNGIGIPHDKIGQVIVLGRSLKRERHEGRYGFMGFGLTFVAFQTSYLLIESVHDGIKSARGYRNLYEYVFKHGSLPDAEKKPKPQPTAESRGTKIEIDFRHVELRQDRQADLDKLFGYADNAKLFECILRTKTAAGNSEFLFNRKPPCEIDITAALNGKTYQIPFRYLGMLEILSALEVDEKQCYEYSKFEQLIAITEHEAKMERERKRRVKAIRFAADSPLKVGERSPISASFYIFATSKDYINRYNEKILQIESDAPEGVTNGAILSLDGMPTSIKLSSESKPWNHPSYLPFTVIIDAQSLQSDLDAGRKGITSYRASQLLNEADRLLKEKKFLQYRRYVTDAALVPPIMSNAKDTMKETVDRDKRRNSAASLSQQWFPPLEEQEVIALFMELIGRERLDGY